MNKSDTYIQRARRRARRRKSPWNFILFPLSAAAIGCVGYILVSLLLALQHSLIPEDAILASGTSIGHILLVLAFFPALTIGMIIANLIAWCIPSARRAFEREAKGRKRADFKSSMKTLSTASVIALLVVGPLCLLGALNYFYVTPSGVYLNSLFSIRERHYGWNDIEKIRTRCLAERRNLHLNYILYMNDGKKVDLLNEPRLKFVNVYEQIVPFLQDHPHILYECEMRDTDIALLKQRYHHKDAEKILSILIAKHNKTIEETSR